MRVTLSVFGVLLDVTGAIRILQGINVLQGSFMSGDIDWAICGGIAAANRQRRA